MYIIEIIAKNCANCVLACVIFWKLCTPIGLYFMREGIDQNIKLSPYYLLLSLLFQYVILLSFRIFKGWLISPSTCRRAAAIFMLDT